MIERENILKAHSPMYRRLRACDRIAYIIQQTQIDGFQPDTRIFENFLIYDGLTFGGISKQARIEGGRTIREHVVPRKLIRDEAMGMFANGCSLEDVAKAISRHLHIVQITRQERDRIDKELKWKNCMPPNWRWNEDCPFERLRQGRIEFDIEDLALEAIGLSREEFVSEAADPFA